MSAADAGQISAIEIAQAEAYGWRGRSLSVFARGEHAISQTLLHMHEHLAQGAKPKLQHLPGQRSDTLAKAVAGLNLTKKQAEGLVDCLDRWRALERERNFLAHGIQKIAIDAAGDWVCILDMTVFRSDSATEERLTLTKEEAIALTVEFETVFKILSAKLGMLRSIMTKA